VEVDTKMNRREAIKLGILGIVAPGAVYQTLKSEKSDIDVEAFCRLVEEHASRHCPVIGPRYLHPHQAWVEPTSFDKCTIHYPDGSYVTHDLGPPITFTNVTSWQTT